MIILSTSSLAGCIDLTPPQSLIQAPRMLIDYDNETGTFEIYIHGIEDYKYDSITFSAISPLSNESTSESKNMTYALIQKFALTNFTLDVMVKAHKTLYEYNATVAVETEADGAFAITVTTNKGGTENVQTLNKDELPYIVYLERLTE